MSERSGSFPAAFFGGTQILVGGAGALRHACLEGQWLSTGTESQPGTERDLQIQFQPVFTPTHFLPFVFIRRPAEAGRCCVWCFLRGVPLTDDGSATDTVGQHRRRGRARQDTKVASAVGHLLHLQSGSGSGGGGGGGEGPYSEPLLRRGGLWLFFSLLNFRNFSLNHGKAHPAAAAGRVIQKFVAYVGPSGGLTSSSNNYGPLA